MAADPQRRAGLLWDFVRNLGPWPWLSLVMAVVAAGWPRVAIVLLALGWLGPVWREVQRQRRRRRP